jgi:hypothetical protein
MKNALLTMIGLATMSLSAVAQQKPAIPPSDASAAPQVEVPEGAFEIAIPNLSTSGSLPADGEIVLIEDEGSEQARLGRDVIIWHGPIARAIPQRPISRVALVGESDVTAAKGGATIRIVRRYPAALKVVKPVDENAPVAAVPGPDVSELNGPEPDVPSAAEMLATASAGYSLANATPNPVSTAAQISFTLPRSGETKLSVFDNAGRVVATLADEVLDAGTYTRTFDASSLPAGLYLYRLSSGSYAETKTMTVVR